MRLFVRARLFISVHYFFLVFILDVRQKYVVQHSYKINVNNSISWMQIVKVDKLSTRPHHPIRLCTSPI